ncbi:MAG: nucleotidyltransferase family protein [Eubacterium sp.]|nr:nucleotidyltransferase family protein [Eubacterium sp.]
MSDPSSRTILGIAAEFDPFHEGHRYLIEQAAAISPADGVVAVMSGNFVQRGNPAVFDKWTRAEEAVRGGVDLVLELPFLYACADAGTFARGAVSILEGFGIVDKMVFGSESGDLEALKAACTRIDRAEASDLLKEKLGEGLSYPAARQAALEALFPEADQGIYGEPNNILALEYLRALRDRGSFMEPLTIKRSGEGHQASASRIRHRLRQEEPLRWAARDRRLFDLLRVRILTQDPALLEAQMGDGEGLSNRLLKEIRRAENLTDLIGRLKTKRYTWSGISRMLMRVLLGLDGSFDKAAKPYVRPLAFNERGAALLRQAKKEERITIPVVESLTRAMQEAPDLSATLLAEIRAGDVFTLIEGESLYGSCDLVRRARYVR